MNACPSCQELELENSDYGAAKAAIGFYRRALVEGQV